MARPTKYKPEYAKQAQKLCNLGADDANLADFFEVSRSTINLWKVQFSEFSDAVKVGKAPADERVKQSLYNRALGYSHEEDDIRVIGGEIVVTPTVKHYPPDTAAMIFWLKNRMPDEFRANPDEGNGDQKDHNITINLVDAKKPE